jgi:hypothetical protein
MALKEFLILRKPRSGCLEERTALIQPIDNSFTASKGRDLFPGWAPAFARVTRRVVALPLQALDAALCPERLISKEQGGRRVRLAATERIGRAKPHGKRFLPLVGLPEDDNRVTAGTVSIIAEGTVGGGREFEAIAGLQLVRDLAFHEDEPSVQRPDEMTDEGISGGEGDRGIPRRDPAGARRS